MIMRKKSKKLWSEISLYFRAWKNQVDKESAKQLNQVMKNKQKKLKRQGIFLRLYSLMMVTLEQPKRVAVIYNCYVKVVHWRIIFVYYVDLRLIVRHLKFYGGSFNQCSYVQRHELKFKVDTAFSSIVKESASRTPRAITPNVHKCFSCVVV